MQELTTQQKRVLDFIQSHQRSEGIVPTLREIARHFGFRSMTAAADHVRALRRKKVLAESDRRARPLQRAAGRVRGRAGAFQRRKVL